MNFTNEIQHKVNDIDRVRPYHPEKVAAAIDRLYRLRPVYSNYFGQSIDDRGDYIETESTLVLRKAEENFYRVYALSSSSEGLVNVLKNLPGVNVLNVPTKESIQTWQAILQQSGFEYLATYERYYYKQVRKVRNDTPINYAVPEQTEEIHALFHSNFSPYTGYLPSKRELEELISKREVVVNFDADGRLCGAFIYELKGRKCYMRAWYDNGGNGLKLLFDVYCIMNLHQIAYANFWVNSANTGVKRIHELLGAVPDGLKDYTFVKTPAGKENESMH